MNEMEPELAGIMAELAAREPIFHRPEWGVTRADFEAMTADDFWEALPAAGIRGLAYWRFWNSAKLSRAMTFGRRWTSPAGDWLRMCTC
jgi:hypothetical protein